MKASGLVVAITLGSVCTSVFAQGSSAYRDLQKAERFGYCGALGNRGAEWAPDKQTEEKFDNMSVVFVTATVALAANSDNIEQGNKIMLAWLDSMTKTFQSLKSKTRSDRIHEFSLNYLECIEIDYRQASSTVSDLKKTLDHARTNELDSTLALKDIELRTRLGYFGQWINELGKMLNN